jgi:hypothetical protein
MNMFKKLLVQMLFAAALFNATAASAAVVNLSLNGSAQVGSTFTVEVWANDLFDGLASDEELLAFGMTVANSSAELFSFTGASIAAPFADDSAWLGLDAAGSAFPGVVNEVGSQSILLASLTFFAHDAGNGSLGIRTDLLDPSQGLIFFQNGAVSMNADLAVNVSPVPLPATLPILLGGMSLLAGIARRRNTL